MLQVEGEVKGVRVVVVYPEALLQGEVAQVLVVVVHGEEGDPLPQGPGQGLGEGGLAARRSPGDPDDEGLGRAHPSMIKGRGEAPAPVPLGP